MKIELMISIRPEHAFNILNGNKTLELRKTVPKDFNGWVYIYVTKAKPLLRLYPTGYFIDKTKNYYTEDFIKQELNGKVVARFRFDEYDTYSIEKPVKNIMALILNKQDNSLGMDKFTYENLVNKSCVDINDIWDYAKPSKNSPDKQRWIYAWHIKKLEIFDTPLSLSDFYKATLYTLKRAPQSYQYVYRKCE